MPAAAIKQEVYADNCQHADAEMSASYTMQMGRQVTSASMQKQPGIRQRAPHLQSLVDIACSNKPEQQFLQRETELTPVIAMGGVGTLLAAGAAVDAQPAAACTLLHAGAAAAGAAA